MSKKSFKDINPALQFLSSAQEEQDTQEVQDTQGRKGQKLPRINMAFQVENLEYLQLISRVEGVSITRYVNRLVENDKEKNAETIEKAKALLKG